MKFCWEFPAKFWRGRFLVKFYQGLLALKFCRGSPSPGILKSVHWNSKGGHLWWKSQGYHFQWNSRVNLFLWNSVEDCCLYTLWNSMVDHFQMKFWRSISQRTNFGEVQKDHFSVKFGRRKIKTNVNPFSHGGWKICCLLCNSTDVSENSFLKRLNGSLGTPWNGASGGIIWMERRKWQADWWPWNLRRETGPLDTVVTISDRLDKTSSNWGKLHRWGTGFKS